MEYFSYNNLYKMPHLRWQYNIGSPVLSLILGGNTISAVLYSASS